MTGIENEQKVVKWLDGTEHWVNRGPSNDIKLFLWHKPRRSGTRYAGTILFIHGSSQAAQPTYDLHVPGVADTSVMQWFAERGFDTWCLDNEGYGRSSKHRDINFNISNGVDDIAAAASYVIERSASPKLMMYGISSGALKVALFAQRHPDLVDRIALDAFVWTGKGSPTLEERAKRLPEWRSKNRRPLNREFITTIFTRDHPGSADDALVSVYADAVLALDDSVPTGTYLDMCANLPIVDPVQVKAPTLVMRGEFDGIATYQDISEFFALLPSSDKQLSIMPGVSHASIQGKNFLLAFHIVHGFFSMPPRKY
ncbi:MAG: alpha/beta fold hydrolase [Polaromonas sp.]|nr:alpha/beta fold hydrolase [Polaromonas sp.]